MREHNNNNNNRIFSAFKNAEGEENPSASPWRKALAAGFHGAAVPITSSAGKEMRATKRKRPC